LPSNARSFATEVAAPFRVLARSAEKLLGLHRRDAAGEIENSS
jgi:hypothetical protein